MERAILDFGYRALQSVRHSFLIALPPNWIRSLELEKGDQVKIELMPDNSLRITPRFNKPTKEE